RRGALVRVAPVRGRRARLLPRPGGDAVLRTRRTLARPVGAAAPESGPGGPPGAGRARPPPGDGARLAQPGRRLPGHSPAHPAHRDRPRIAADRGDVPDQPEARSEGIVSSGSGGRRNFVTDGPSAASTLPMVRRSDDGSAPSGCAWLQWCPTSVA